METVFVKSYELTYSHIDWRGVARPAAYFDFMQDAATVHAHMAHLDSGALSAIWVLSRIHAEFERPLAPYDTLQLSTWCAGIKGASWLRAFAFAVNGEPVGRAISSWVILDPETHRILRPGTVPAAANYVCAERPTMPMPGKLECSELPLHHTHQVTYSDLDINHHLNNVRIAALVSDTLELSETDFVRSIQINYTAETPPDAKLMLYAQRTQDTFAVYGISEGCVRFQAAGTFGRLL